MDEFKMLGRIEKLFQRSFEQENRFLECDAEIVRWNEGRLAFSIDEFSAAEDGFNDSDAERLGRNLAVATISDLLAAGATPRWYLHSFSCPSDWPLERLEDLSRGIEATLRRAGANLLGGDFARSAQWRYTGVAIGSLAGPARTRIAPDGPLTLFVSGQIGDGNRMVVDPDYNARFECRRTEAEAAGSATLLGMDTSDGLRSTLITLRDLNPRHDISINVDRIPIHPDADQWLEAAGLPRMAAVFGGAGEYELVLGVPDEQTEIFSRRHHGYFSPIGSMKPGHGRLFWETSKGKLADPGIYADARDSDRDTYIKAVIEAAGKI